MWFCPASGGASKAASDREERRDAAHEHDSVGESWCRHQHLSDRVRPNVLERRARLDNQHLAIFIRQMILPSAATGDAL